MSEETTSPSIGDEVEVSFQPIETTTLNERVVQAIRDAILTGKLPPGTRLNETRLARDLRMSRIPLREALQRLEEQGLLVNVPRKGRFVVSLTNEEVQKINSLRLVLEVEALRLCRAKIVRSQEAELTSLVYKWEDNISSMNANEGAELDLRIHQAIWSFTGNEYIFKTLTGLTLPLFAHRVIRKFNVELQQWGHNTHIPLLDFVQKKSNAAAKDVMLKHLQFGWESPDLFSSEYVEEHISGSPSTHKMSESVTS
jgi:DNA-binding GntR family transcriptional regulator